MMEVDLALDIRGVYMEGIHGATMWLHDWAFMWERLCLALNFCRLPAWLAYASCSLRMVSYACCDAPVPTSKAFPYGRFRETLVNRVHRPCHHDNVFVLSPSYNLFHVCCTVALLVYLFLMG